MSDVRAYRLLRDPAESVRLALESGAIIGTWEWDMPLGRFAGDEGCSRVFSLDFEAEGGSLPLETVAATVHPDDWPAIEAVSQRVLAQGGITHVEFRVRQPEGTYRWVQCSGRCEFNQQSRPHRFAGVLLDIDIRKRTEERLRQSEASARESSTLLNAVIEAVPALIYVKDREGRLQTANAAVLALVGKSWDEVRNRTDAEILADPVESARIMATDQRLMETGAIEELEEQVGHDAVGPRIWLSHKKAIRSPDGDVVGLVGTSVEITHRKRAEQATASSEAHLRRVLDNLFAFVGIVDLDGNLIEANRAPVEGAGLTFNQVLGRPLWDAYWWSHDPATRDLIRDSVFRACAGETVRFDVEILWRDESRLTIDYQIAPLRNQDGEITLLIPSGVDVTARKEAEAQRQLLILELKHRVQNLFTIASGMVTMTARSATSTAEMATALTGRLAALARAHTLINPAISDDSHAPETRLDALISTIVAPHLPAGGNELELIGRAVPLLDDATTGLALIFHELATNSAKYGCLSTPGGTLEISWKDDGDVLVLRWMERGGPLIEHPPDRHGFGSRLVRSTIRQQFLGDLEYDWEASGLIVTLRAQRQRLEALEPPA
jgi:PAS domain S-box-containing protein